MSSVAKSSTAYLAKRALPNLTAEQERHLIGVVQEGDKRAKERLFKAVTPLVLSTARTVHSKTLEASIDRDDLVSEGFIGLERAVRNFDPEKKVRFYSYAKHDIRYAMLRYVAANMAIVSKGRGSRDVIRRFFQISKMITDAMDTEVIGKKDTADATPYTVVPFRELSDMFGVSVSDLEAVHTVLLGDTVPLNYAEDLELLDGSKEIERQGDRAKIMAIIQEFRENITPTQRMALDHVVLERDIKKLRQACDGTDVNYQSAISCSNLVRRIMTRHVRSKLSINEVSLKSLNEES